MQQGRDLHSKTSKRLIQTSDVWWGIHVQLGWQTWLAMHATIWDRLFGFVLLPWHPLLGVLCSTSLRQIWQDQLDQALHSKPNYWSSGVVLYTWSIPELLLHAMHRLLVPWENHSAIYLCYRLDGALLQRDHHQLGDHESQLHPDGHHFVLLIG